MPSRRQFLRTGVAASAVLAAPEVHAQSSASHPAPIASLKSMKSLAKPITVEERRQRIERARQLMADNKLDAIAIAGGASLIYFSDIRWWLSERFFAMVLPAKGNPFYVCPAFEEDRAREQISRGPLGDSADVRIWQEDENPYERFAQGLKDHGLTTGRIGLEETMYYVYTNSLAKTMPGVQFESATPVTAGCRMIKSDHELELMKLACKVTFTAFEAAWKSLRPGMTDREFGGLLEAAHAKLGFPGDALVMVGPYAALPHGTINPQTIRENDLVLIDGGCTVEGYVSDISRTFVVGKATDKMKQVFDIVHRAQKAAYQAAKAGNPCSDVDAAARKVVVDAGYGPGYKYFAHRLGHGMGMDGHEWPYLVKGNQLALQKNMTFSDEPGIYIRGEFGVRLEDDQIITENGGQLMTPQSPSLEEPFGK